MRPQLLKVQNENGYSFSMRQDLVPYINNKWHYHKEVELIYFKKGEGTQFIGDNINRFKSGDVVMVGRYLPHFWRFDDIYFEEGADVSADVKVAHFTEDFWGGNFLSLPENKNLKAILEKSKRGLQMEGKSRRIVAGLLEQLTSSDGSKRIVLLIEAISSIAECKQLVPLSSVGFEPDFDQSDKAPINDIYEYLIKNFKEQIRLKSIAEVGNISPNSFCRYFKSHTGKTFSQFLIELRVGHACKLLIENKECIKRICFESGFNNFTSFYKYFKLIKGKSPFAYQKEFLSE